MTRPISIIVCVLALGCDAEAKDAPPDAPSDLEVAAVPGGAHSTWVDASDDEDEFVIERRGMGEFEELGTVPFDTTAYHDGTATKGTWVYRVGARNDAGESWSAEVSVTIE